jgi:hypothetical protein
VLTDKWFIKNGSLSDFFSIQAATVTCTMLKKREGRSQVIGQSRQGHAAPHRTGEDSQIQIYYVSFVGFFFFCSDVQLH